MPKPPGFRPEPYKSYFAFVRSRNRRREPIRGRLVRRAPLLVALGTVLALSGCDDGVSGAEGAQTISGETFVDVMVALRSSPLLDPSGYLPVGVPEQILTEHGVSPDAMRRFVEVHGSNVPLMTEIWAKVDSLVTEARRAREPES